MKTLISAQTVQDAVSHGQKEIAIDPQTIITPQARDIAAKEGIVFVEKAVSPDTSVGNLSAERIYQCLSALVASGSLNQSFLEQLQALSTPHGLHLEHVQDLPLTPNAMGHVLHETALKTLKTEIFALNGQGKSCTVQKETLFTVVDGQIELSMGAHRSQLSVGDSFAAMAGVSFSLRAFGQARLTATEVR